MFGVVTEQDFRELGRSDVIARLELVEILEDSSFLPSRVIKPAIDRGRGVKARNADWRRLFRR
jgi:hypothetical protein